MRKTVCIIAITMLTVVSCGVFDPRPAEYPSTTTVVDQFNFASILWNTGKQITKLDYNDIFSDSATFADINDNVFDRKLLIDHLQDASIRFAIDQVTWSTDSLADFTIADTFFVDRRYHVAMRDTLLSKSYVFDDNASFKLTFNANKNTWDIFYFKDKYPGKSIFHPLFQPSY